MSLDPFLLGGASLLAGGAWMLYRGTHTMQEMRASTSKAESLPQGCLPVLTGIEVIRQAGAEGLMASIRSKVGLAQTNYDRDYLPALHKYAEFVQLLPASESHHHAQPGGLVIHALEATDIALTLRRGVVLPIGAHPEDLMHHEHRWTYGVFVAALLHDIGRPVADLRVTAYGREMTVGRFWTPLAGTLCEIGATHYRIEFTDPASRDYQAHTRLGVAMLNRIVPQTTLSWLSEDKALMDELTAYLFGESKGGAIRDLAIKSDGESVRRNLMTGPRTRFAASRAVPLIERMMEAQRRMLAEGGLLPLNRSGGAGWVFEGDIWFVSKRLADEVRRYLQANESAAGIPGEDKNDRLFDVWQEYGALTPNPETGGAIWHARIEGDGYNHTFTMLRFPLHTLYRQPENFPAPMAGRIVVVEKKTAAGGAAAQENEFTTQPTTRPAQPIAKKTAPPELPNALENSPATDGAVDALAGLRALIDGGGDTADSLPQSTSGGVLPQRSGLVTVTLAQSPSDDGFLDDHEDLMDVAEGQETASRARRKETAPAKPPQAGRYAPAVKQPKVPTPQVLAPVVPHTPAPPRTAPESIPENAKRLMAWIQEGIGNGTLVYNVPGALIHFVEENGAALMLLVSPRIFRYYLDSIGQGDTGEPVDMIGAALQKDFFKSGWQRVGMPGKKNVLRYRVKRRNSEEGSLLSVVVIPQPERFVNPVPPPNPHIVAFADAVDGSGGLAT